MLGQFLKMSKNEVYIAIESQLKKSADFRFAVSRNLIVRSEFFSYGVKTSSIRKIAKDYLKSNPDFQNNSNCLDAIKGLLSSKIFDVQAVGVFLAASINIPKDHFERMDLLTTYREWTEAYIKDWAICDTFGTEVIAPALQDDDESRQFLNDLSLSDNRWSRRIALVSLIKAKTKFNDWQNTLAILLVSYSEEKDYFVKKAIRWAQAQKYY